MAAIISIRHHHLDKTCDRVRWLEHERRNQTPYHSREISVTLPRFHERSHLHDPHDGPGIDVSPLPPQLETAAMDHAWLRGIVRIPSVMDDLRYDDHARPLCLHHKAAANNKAEWEWE